MARVESRSPREKKPYQMPWKRGEVVLKYEHMSPGLKALVDEIAFRRGARDLLTGAATVATDAVLFPSARRIASVSPALGQALLAAAAVSVAGGVYTREGEKVRDATMELGQKLRDKLNERFDRKARARVKDNPAVSDDDIGTIISSGARLLYVNRNKALVKTNKVPLVGYIRVPLYLNALTDAHRKRLAQRRSLPKEA